MSDDTGRSLLLATFLIAVFLVTWEEIRDNHRVPIPGRYIGAGIIWGTLGLVAPFITYPLAGALGAGFAVALLYQHWQIKGGNNSANNPNGWGSGEPPVIEPPQSL